MGDIYKGDIRGGIGGLAGSGIMGQGQMSGPWRSAEGLSPEANIEKEFNKFQIRANEPTARAAEQEVFNDYRSQDLHPWNLDMRPRLDWSEGKQDILGWDVRPRNIERISPATNAGITNPNLNDYKVMNAGWRDWINPFGNKINELNVENQRLLKEIDDIRMNPRFPEPGPWNEFDPYLMDMDDGGDGYDWDSSKGTEVVGTTEDKWGQLVRDGVVNPGDTLNPLQIDQLYNLYYEGGAGDMDQFGVT